MSWEENVRKVVPYVAGEQPKDTDVIKLNTNECPYPPAPGVEKRAKELCVDRLRLYPNMDAAELVAAIADYYNVKESEVFVGVGSDDVLGTVISRFCSRILPIPFMMSGQSFLRFRMKPVHWMKPSGSARRIISARMGESLFRIPMHRQRSLRTAVY